MKYTDNNQKMANTTEGNGHGGGEIDMNSPDEATEMDVTSPLEVEHVDHTPCQVEKYLDFINFNKDGHLLMGSSNLTGRYWGGSVWYYKDAHLAPDVEKCTSGHEVSSGIGTGIFTDDDISIMIGHDTGTVEFMALVTSGTASHLRSVCQVDEHEDVVTDVELSCNKKTALTSSADASVKLWDTEGYRVIRTLSSAHSQTVLAVSAHPSNEQVFLTTGMDGNVLLWDLRCIKAASCMYEDWDDKPNCVGWEESRGPGIGNYFIGTQSGKLLLRNSKNCNENLSSYQAFDRPVFRLKRNPYQPHLIAACADETKVVVLDIAEEKIKLRYEDDRHVDFVRGLAWKDADTLASCGWDKKVYFHQL